MKTLPNGEHMIEEQNKQEEIMHSEQLNEVFKALAMVQAEIEPAVKDKANPYFKSKYADLTAVWEACREPLHKNGLCVLQTVEGNKSDMFLVTWLGHSSGQWIRSKLPLLLVKHDPQAQGSAITYARRYALSALVGVVADDDDDGEKAMVREKKSKAALHEPVQSSDENAELETYLSSFAKEERADVAAYFRGYAKHWKKSISETMQDYQDKSKLLTDVNRWKESKLKKAA